MAASEVTLRLKPSNNINVIWLRVMIITTSVLILVAGLNYHNVSSQNLELEMCISFYLFLYCNRDKYPFSVSSFSAFSSSHMVSNCHFYFYSLLIFKISVFSFVLHPKLSDLTYDREFYFFHSLYFSLTFQHFRLCLVITSIFIILTFYFAWKGILPSNV